MMGMGSAGGGGGGGGFGRRRFISTGAAVMEEPPEKCQWSKNYSAAEKREGRERTVAG